MIYEIDISYTRKCPIWRLIIPFDSLKKCCDYRRTQENALSGRYAETELKQKHSGKSSAFKRMHDILKIFVLLY